MDPVGDSPDRSPVPTVGRVTQTNSTSQSLVAALNPERGVWIDGEKRAGRLGGTFEVIDPANAKVIATVANGLADDAIDSVDAASAALPQWAATAPRDRSQVLRTAFELMVSEIDDLATIIAAENGKVLADARAEVRYAAEFFRWYAEEAVRSEGSFGAAPAGGIRSIVTHRPVGVAALVTPWNFPAAMVTRKIAPALAAGCSTVLKPAAETPLTAIAIMKVLQRAGLPPGVANLVPSTAAEEVVTAWLTDPRVRKLSFTGSTPVGRHLLRQSAERVVNTSMELGGNAPFVVCADADVEAAVSGAMVAKFRNGGQACTAANRFLVHEDVADRFVELMGHAISRLRVGPAQDLDSDIGPLISDRAQSNVASLMEDALASGARVVARAEVPKYGFFSPPTLLVDLPEDSALLSTEIFGPLAAVVTWRDIPTLLAMVNGSEAGLASYVYSGDCGAAIRLAEQFDTGMVAINRGVVSDPSAPFGGTRQSGIGREGAREGMREFQETQYLAVQWD